MRATPYSDEELRSLGHGDGDGSHEAYLAQEVAYLREWIAYSAECVGAQTMDISRLGKNRRECLGRIIRWMEALALGQIQPPPPQYGHSSLLKLMKHGSRWSDEQVGSSEVDTP